MQKKEEEEANVGVVAVVIVVAIIVEATGAIEEPSNDAVNLLQSVIYIESYP